MTMTKELLESKRLADEGKEEHQWAMGIRYFHGEDVPQDKLQGYKYLLKSAKQEYPIALRDIGYMYAEKGNRNHLSIKYLEKCIEQYEPLFKEYINIDVTMHDLAVTYDEMNKYDKAYRMFRRLADKTDDMRLKRVAVDMAQSYVGTKIKFRQEPNSGIELIDS